MGSQSVCTHWMYQYCVLYLAWWWFSKPKHVAVIFSFSIDDQYICCVIDWINYYINSLLASWSRVQIPVGTSNFLFSITVQTNSGANSVSSSMGTRVLSQGCEVDHSPQSSAEVKNEYSCTSTPLICLHSMDTRNMTFYHFTEIIICDVTKCDISTSTWWTHYCFIYESVKKVYQESRLEPTGLGLNTLSIKKLSLNILLPPFTWCHCLKKWPSASFEDSYNGYTFKEIEDNSWFQISAVK
jgi:hypothetical protein